MQSCPLLFLRSMVHEIVGRINGQFGTLTYVPIYHLDTSLSFTDVCALYAVADVAMVTSLVSSRISRQRAQNCRSTLGKSAMEASDSTGCQFWPSSSVYHSDFVF
jgi:hypothetical protein